MNDSVKEECGTGGMYNVPDPGVGGADGYTQRLTTTLERDQDREERGRSEGQPRDERQAR